MKMGHSKKRRSLGRAAFGALLGFLAFGDHTNAQYQTWGSGDAIMSFEHVPGGGSYSHPSNITITRDGSMLLVYTTGLSEGEATNIAVSRKAKGSNSWQLVGKFAPAGRNSGFDPVVYQPSKPGSPVLLWYYNQCCEDQYMRSSSDDGKTWSAEYATPSASLGSDYHKKFEGPEQNAPLEMPDGSLLASYSIRIKGKPQTNWTTRIPANNYTGKEPGGSAWEAQKLPGEGGQGSFLVLDPPKYQKLGLIIRETVHGEGKIQFSDDGGKTWGTPVKLGGGRIQDKATTSAKAGIAGISLDVKGGALQGWHLAAGSAGYSGLGRDVLRILASEDAKSWKAVLEIKLDVGGEHADPSFVQAADGTVYLAFTGRDQSKIAVFALDPAKLVGSKSTAMSVPPRMHSVDAVTHFGNGWTPLPLNFRGGSSIEIFSPDGRRVRTWAPEAGLQQDLSRRLNPGAYHLRTR